MIMDELTTVEAYHRYDDYIYEKKGEKQVTT